MDVNSIVTLIGSLGFPIVGLIYLAGYVKTLIATFMQEQKEMREQQKAEALSHKEEVMAIANELHSLSKNIQQLIDNFFSREE